MNPSQFGRNVLGDFLVAEQATMGGEAICKNKLPDPSDQLVSALLFDTRYSTVLPRAISRTNRTSWTLRSSNESRP
jgi:hypothetical protein